MFLFEDTYYFYYFAAIPLMVLLYGVVLWWKKRAQKRFADRAALNKLSPTKSRFKPLLKLMVLCLTVAALVVALANPRVGAKTETVKREGVDIVFALDVSKSMDAEDVAPSRMEKSKQLISQIINQLGGDRIGIVGYAGSAFPQLPITTDFNAARMFLSSMNTDMVSSQGTALSEAIRLGTTFFDDEEQPNRMLVIISDGEDHEGRVEEAIAQAVEQGIRIHTIGVGTPAGGPIPIKRNGILQSYHRDRNGDRVVTKLVPETLEYIAEKGNGGYTLGNHTAQVLDYMQEALNNMDKASFEAQQVAGFKSRFQWFAGLAFVLLLLDVFLSERKTDWLRKLNLFDEGEKD